MKLYKPKAYYKRDSTEYTYWDKVSFQSINGIKQVDQLSSCACAHCGPGLGGFLSGHALWMWLCQQLRWCLAKIVDHSFGGLALSGVCDGIEVHGTLRIRGEFIRSMDLS